MTKIVTDLKFLNQPCMAVEQHEVASIANQLLTAFAEQEVNQAVGLAANQIGILKNMFCVKLPWWEKPKVFINASINLLGSQIIFEEQCLSLPGVSLKCYRHSLIKVNYTDINGNMVEEKYGCDIPDLSNDGMMKMMEAVVIAHEFWHQEGKTIYDFAVKKKNWSNSDDIIVSSTN